MLLHVWSHNTVVCISHNGEGKIAATYLPSGGTKIGIWSSVAGGPDKFDVIKMAAGRCVICVVDAPTNLY